MDNLKTADFFDVYSLFGNIEKATFTMEQGVNGPALREVALKMGDSLEDFEGYEIVKPPVRVSKCNYNVSDNRYTCFIDKDGTELYGYTGEGFSKMYDALMNCKYIAVVKHIKPTLVFLKAGQSMPKGKVLVKPVSVWENINAWPYIKSYKSFIGTDGVEHSTRSVAAFNKSQEECLFIAIIERG